MGLQDIVANCTLHAGFGFGVGMLDYATHRYMNNPEHREAYKTRVVEALTGILRANSVGLAEGEHAPYTPDSVEYARDMDTARSYLRDIGLIRTKRTFWQGVKELPQIVSSAVRDEKVNDLGFRSKLILASVVEIAYDWFHEWGALTEKGDQPIKSVAMTPLQIMSFVGGMYLGKGVGYVWNFSFRSSVERDLDSSIKGLLKAEITDVSLVELVTKYAPSEEVREAAQSTFSPAKVTVAGKRMAKQAASAFSSASDSLRDHLDFSKRAAEAARKEEEERQKRKARFDELTKDR
ncbi:hypothetical protein J4464_06500 [Candidatus Woesearchaeota archaeon]|nr:hypothetical protein [Candidatus Woesearchaeota archaeon]